MDKDVARLKMYYRQNKAATIKKIAAGIDVSPATVFSWFSGRRKPTEKARYRIRRYLQRPP